MALDAKTFEVLLPLRVEVTFDVREEAGELAVSLKVTDDVEMLKARVPELSDKAEISTWTSDFTIPLPTEKEYDPANHIEEMETVFVKSLRHVIPRMIGLQIPYSYNEAIAELYPVPRGFRRKTREAHMEKVSGMFTAMLGIARGRPEKDNAATLEKKVAKAARARWRARGKRGKLTLADVAKEMGLKEETLDSRLKRKGVLWSKIRNEVTRKGEA
jgi:hypothetical protein